MLKPSGVLPSPLVLTLGPGLRGCFREKGTCHDRKGVCLLCPGWCPWVQLVLRCPTNYTHCMGVKYTRSSADPAPLCWLQSGSRNQQWKLAALSGQCKQQRRNICRFLFPSATEVRGIVLLIGNSPNLPIVMQTFSIAFLESFEMFTSRAHPQETFVHDRNLFSEVTAYTWFSVLPFLPFL